MRASLAGAVLFAAVTGCTDQSPSTSDAGTDAEMDVAVDQFADALDAMPVADANDAETSVTPTTWNDISDSANWATFNIPTGTEAFAGAAFDGRYVYFVPAASGVIARYDTTVAFNSSSSWTTFDLTTVNAGFTGFAGAAFDGQYLYFAPHYGGGIVVRYDTTAAFAVAGSYASSIDTLAVSGGTSPYYNGATFDGQYVYFMPYEANGGVIEGTIVRYDTHQAFGAMAGWQASGNDTSVNANAKGFQGGLFDGRYVYAVPIAYSSPSGWSGIVTRYDTAGSFTVDSSWLAFDVTSVNGSAKGFVGAVFDGRYAYFVPYDNGAYDGVVARLDTQGAFNNASAWAPYDVASNVNAAAKGFATGAFDGRYVYLVPLAGSTLARVDTQAALDGGTSWFTTAGSWKAFDIATINANAKQFFGAAFDGQYIYLAPNANGVVARFSARTPAALPPGYAHGSFY